MSIAIAIGAGIILILLETVLPGLIAGISGGFLMGLGIFLSFRDYGTGVGIVVLSGSILSLIIIGIIWLKYFPQSSFAKIFISERSIGGDIGEEVPSELIGKEGIAVTRLYSCGKVKVGNELLDAITNGEGIEAGSPIKIIAVEGFKIIVQEIIKEEN